MKHVNVALTTNNPWVSIKMAIIPPPAAPRSRFQLKYQFLRPSLSSFHWHLQHMPGRQEQKHWPNHWENWIHSMAKMKTGINIWGCSQSQFRWDTRGCMASCQLCPRLLQLPWMRWQRRGEQTLAPYMWHRWILIHLYLGTNLYKRPAWPW